MSTQGAGETPEQQSPSDSTTAETTANAAPRPRSKARSWLARLGIGFGVFVVVAGVGLGGADYYTSRPDFCGSCHIMDPHYESWTRDIHGAKIGVKCIDCHYAPGERFTVMAKFRGLSQVASYFSGRYGAGRPRAHVADASCLRSGCHGDLAHFNKLLPIGEPRIEKRIVDEHEVEVRRDPSVYFVHQKHLDTTARRDELEKEIATVTERLRGAAQGDQFAKIERAAMSVGPAHLREAALQKLGKDLALSESTQKDALALMQLNHRRVRVDQLAGLNCSACHAFDASLKRHIGSDRSVCFTCHFTNEEFNRNTSECLRCHEPPRRNVNVHAGPTQADNVVMNHDDIVRRGVDCVSCHRDVVRGESRVAERECTHCHDQAKYLEEFATRTTETVRKYHEVHIHNQRAHCYDCHQAMQHGLIDPAAPLAHSEGFLEPVVNDCQHCHPNHHAQQVGLLTGTGGADIARPIPNAMVGSRLNCRACHTQSGESDKGDSVVRATRESCAACHSDDYMKMFDSWKSELDQLGAEAATRLEKIGAALAAQHKLSEADAKRAQTLFAAARQNVELVRGGGGLHNRAYALQLLDVAREHFAEIERLLTPPPQ